MATYKIESGTLDAIAAAIRSKTSKTAEMTPLEMPAEILSIESGGIVLEPLEHNAAPEHIHSGYQAYNDSGEVVLGEARTYEEGYQAGVETAGSNLTYVVGTPVEFTLTGWDADVQGTTYTLKANGYKIGAGGLQIGLPANDSTVNTNAVVAAALTIVDGGVTAPNTSNNTAGYTTVTISAVNVPDRDVTIALFGLEEATPQVKVTTAAIEGVTVPATGGAPVAAIDSAQFTGTVDWTPKDSNGKLSKFAASTVYTATITLTPKPGYTLTGVAANFFTVEGASSVSNSASSGVVKAVFPATAAEETEAS